MKLHVWQNNNMYMYKPLIDAFEIQTKKGLDLNYFEHVSDVHDNS